MESKSKDLELTILKNPYMEDKEVKVGDNVFLLGSEYFKNPSLLRNRKFLIRLINKNLGKGAYEVIRIYQKNQSVYLDIKGKRGKRMDNILKDYFGVC